MQELLIRATLKPGASIHLFPEEYRKDIPLAMQILIYSKAPISKEELTEAVAVTNYEDLLTVPESLGAVCTEVMVFTLERKFPYAFPAQMKKVMNGRTISYAGVDTKYLTFKEFISMKRNASSNYRLGGRLEPNVANSAIATACLTCLLADSERRVPSPFHDYSVKYWSVHYESTATPDADLQKLALRLLTANHPAFQSLVAQYTFPVWVSKTTCCCPLFVVALEGLSSLVDELLQHEDSHKHHACSALLAASSKGNLGMVKVLLAEQLDFREQARQLACEGGHTEIADLLISDHSDEGSLPIQAVKDLNLGE